MEYTQAHLFKTSLPFCCFLFSNTVFYLLSTFFREEGHAIQSELNEISDIEKQVVGLKSILDQLPRTHASEFRSEISGLASQVKKEKKLLNTTLSKIVNYGVPI
ncbi:hypothetical protein GUJ93_ZPchr0006g44971 [Zizania palustris]|uniref:Uncharacterized protein n=1 Tax=Zizania palustris TaxID=103762 RepID=A0A8J5TD00_ZIZPA|nr:hypothetical protein GUJ93_ZPchr0006g44971 [Zizania palustris]